MAATTGEGPYLYRLMEKSDAVSFLLLVDGGEMREGERGERVSWMDFMAEDDKSR